MGELTQTDLSGLVGTIDEEEDIFKNFEFEQFFDFNEERVNYGSSILFIIFFLLYYLEK